MTFTIKWETMNGQVKTSKIKAETLDDAIDNLCELRRVGNILSASDCYRVKWL